MAKAKARKDSDVVRLIQVDKLGAVQTWTLKHKDVKAMSPRDAAAFEEGLEARSRDFNQGKANSDIEVPSRIPAFWKGYEFARAQEAPDAGR